MALPVDHPQVLGWREQDMETEVPLGEVGAAAPVLTTSPPPTPREDVCHGACDIMELALWVGRSPPGP